jgi:hypothetical protein
MSRKDYFARARREYAGEHGLTEVDPDDVAKWMVDTGRYDPRPLSIVKRCKQELVRALKDERITDPEGREVRANHCIRWREGDTLFSRWVGIYEAKPGRMRTSLAQRLRQMEAQVHQHHTDWSSYNDHNIHGAQLGLFDYDFNKAVDERNQPTQYPDEPPAEDEGDGAAAPV